LRPLIVVSFSTSVVWDQTSRLERSIQALAGGEYRVVASTGRSDIAASALPGNVTLAPYVPHAAVLPHAAALITHAGHGSTCAALALGVPLVCLANPGSDQVRLAQRVAALGAGLALNGETATPAQIAAAARSVLINPAYAATARQLASRIEASNACQTACLRLEALVSRRA
jgi:UDP:flavonoid glycosyltransferase YjiC (YdhE family)